MTPRIGRSISIGIAALVAAACTADRPAPTASTVRIPLYARGAGGVPGGGTNLGTHLDGGGENPPNASRGQGQAIFRIRDDGSSVEYKLIASNIDNAFMGHIHLAPAGVNGPIVVWLFPSTTPGVTAPLGGGRIDGVIAQGTFTAADLTGPLAGHPLSELLDAMRSGGAYVNVHTNDGVAPVTNTPGDIPGGEIRGQLSLP